NEGVSSRLVSPGSSTRRPPNSLDRGAFGIGPEKMGGLARMGTEEGGATLTASTAAPLGRAAMRLPRPPASFIVAGGGAHNPTLMRMITAQLAPAPVESADAVGWSADALEAQAFAFLAARNLRGLPIPFPDTTGGPKSMNRGGLVGL